MSLRDHLRRLFVRRWQDDMERAASGTMTTLAIALVLIGLALLGLLLLPASWRGR